MKKSKKYIVAFKEIDTEQVQVDILDDKGIAMLSIDWAFQILAVKAL